MICSKDKCSGCFACFNVCPKKAISMVEDENGFIYPKIDESKCINCGLCKKVCPSLDDCKFNSTIKCYACQQKESDKLSKSTSGGLAYIFSEYILNSNGIVYSSVFENGFKIQHVRIDNINDLSNIRGSKYVHSYINSCYSDVKKDLLDNKKVLFIGTPCQVAGLKKYLIKEYSNLYTIDIICHGVPSQKYLRDEISKYISLDNIDNLKFRKNNEYKFVIYNKNKEIIEKGIEESFYLQGFFEGAIFRENCYSCRYAKHERVSDITIGDFWGLSSDSSLYDKRDKGVSVAFINTELGTELFNLCNKEFNFEERNCEEAYVLNTQLNHCVSMPKKYHKFKKDYVKYGYNIAYKKYRKFSLFKKKVKKILKKMKLYK